MAVFPQKNGAARPIQLPSNREVALVHGLEKIIEGLIPGEGDKTRYGIFDVQRGVDGQRDDCGEDDTVQPAWPGAGHAEARQ
jgi:hypothetical protein